MKRISAAAIFVLLIVMTVFLASIGGADVEEDATDTEEFKTHDDLLLDINRRLPEFGGMYLSEDNSILYVYVTNGSEHTLSTEAVKQAIEDVLKADPTERRILQLVPAKFSMLQLHTWYSQVRDSVWKNPNVTLTDLEEGNNRIEVGVDSPDAVDKVETSLASLGIPSDAIIVQVRERLVPQSHELTNRATGGVIEGGYRIEAENAQGDDLGGCTIGFNVVRSGEAGFITNSHCTQEEWGGGVDGVEFYQPDPDDSDNLVGEETIDPDFVSGLRGCGEGMACRWSDSTFVRLASGVSQNLGKIAKTGIGITTVSHSSKYRVVKENPFAIEGETVYKVGATSGRTKARISDTCAVPDLLGDFELLCQTAASIIDGSTTHGDSGGPVFKVTNSPNWNDVELVGIHWAGGGTFFYFSPIGQVYLDLGSTDTWDACDPSLDC